MSIKNLIDLLLPARLTDNIDEWVIWVAEQLEKLLYIAFLGIIIK